MTIPIAFVNLLLAVAAGGVFVLVGDIMFRAR